MKDRLMEVVHNLEYDSKELTRENIITEFCDLFGNNDSERENAIDIINNYNGVFRDTNGKVINYSLIRCKVEELLAELNNRNEGKK